MGGAAIARLLPRPGGAPESWILELEAELEVRENFPNLATNCFNGVSSLFQALGSEGRARLAPLALAVASAVLQGAPAGGAPSVSRRPGLGQAGCGVNCHVRPLLIDACWACCASCRFPAGAPSVRRRPGLVGSAVALRTLAAIVCL
jgi:hypothetical protein